MHPHGVEEREGTRNIAFAFWLNFGFTLIEIVGGILTNSVAIVSDALHDLGDSLSLGLAWYFQRLSQRGTDTKYSYGYRRFSVLGALINTTVLTVGSIVIIGRAIPRLLEPEEVHSPGMIGLAVLGVIVNGLAVYRLRNSDSLNQRVVALHLMEDAMGWVAVLVGSVVIYFTDIYWIDPVLSLLITGYILYNAVRNLLASMAIFLQRIPKDVDVEELQAKLNALPGVLDAHDLHVWSLDGRFLVMTLHAQVDADRTMRDLERIKVNIHGEMREAGIHHVTVEFETADTEVEGCEERLKDTTCDHDHGHHGHHHHHH